MVEFRSEMITHENAKKEVKKQREAFQQGSKEAFKNRQEVDERDSIQDEKELLTLLQDIKQGIIVFSFS